MKNLKELRARLVQLQKDAQAIVDKTEMADDDQTRFDSIMAEIAQTKVAVSNREQVEALGAELEESAGRRTEYVEIGGSISGGEDRQRLDPWAGFNGAHDFLKAVHRASSKSGAMVDPRLANVPKLMGAPTNFHRETASDEGYMVPAAIKDGVLEAVDALDEQIFNDVDAEPTSSNTVQFTRDESTPWGSTGVQAYWAAEGTQGTPSRLVTKGGLVQLHKLFAFVSGTDELLEDAPRLFDRLTRKSGMAIAWKGSQAIFEGTGAGQPLGFMNGGSLVVQAKETSQAADSVVAANVAKMFARCVNPSQGIWYINQDVFPQLVTMTLGDQPIFTPPNSGIKGSPGGTLLGRPVKISEHCATLGDEGDIVFANPRAGYYSPRKAGMKFASSMHLYFDYDVEAFRWTFRMGGTPVLESAITPNKGSTTRSHFVTLAART
jgi:HK97 family phage major capsid protein